MTCLRHSLALCLLTSAFAAGLSHSAKADNIVYEFSGTFDLSPGQAPQGIFLDSLDFKVLATHDVDTTPNLFTSRTAFFDTLEVTFDIFAHNGAFYRHIIDHMTYMSSLFDY